MLRKIKKHLRIIRIRLMNSIELKKLERSDHPVLKSVYQSYKSVLENDFTDAEKNIFRKLRRYSEQLSSDSRLISYEVFGSPASKSVASVYQKAASKEIWCKFYFKLIKDFEAHNVLEIGTNLGVSGGYILAAQKFLDRSQFTTMEGIPQLCEIAHAHFNDIISQDRFEIVQGMYEDTFEDILNSSEKYDLAFIDGNHQKLPTLHYFNTLKSKLAKKSILIFDDINWSPAMIETWQIIKNDPQVNFSIDFFKLGIVVIDQDYNRPQKHYNLHLSY